MTDRERLASLFKEHDFDRMSCSSDHGNCCPAGCHDVQESQYDHYVSALGHAFLPPDDAQIVVAEIYGVLYLLEDGRQGFGISHTGDATMTTYLGLVALANQYFLDWRNDND